MKHQQWEKEKEKKGAKAVPQTLAPKEFAECTNNKAYRRKGVTSK